MSEDLALQLRIFELRKLYERGAAANDRLDKAAQAIFDGNLDLAKRILAQYSLGS